MPIDHHYMPDKNLTVFIHSGLITDQEFLSFYVAYFDDPHFDKSFNKMVDLRRTESTQRSPEAIRTFAQLVQSQTSSSVSRPKVAIVAPKDLTYGLVRMYESHSNSSSSKFEIFRTVRPALAWLGAPEDLVHVFGDEPQTRT